MDQSTDASLLVTADWVVPMDSPAVQAVRHGAVRVNADGTVRQVGPLDQLVAPGDPVVRFPGCVVTPGLINAHTHLDMSYWQPHRQSLAGRALHDWVVPVVMERLVRPHEQIAASAVDGARASLAAGVTTVVDVTPGSIAWQDVLRAVEQVPIRRLALVEVVGFGHRGQSIWDQAEVAMGQASGARNLLGVGVSPHAPYSTGSESYLRALAEAIRSQRVVMTHLAETHEEMDFCLHGSGPWRHRVEQLAGLETELNVPHCSPIRYAERLGLLDFSPTLLVHVNYLTPGDLDLLAGATGRPTVVYCPRSCSFFHHRRHPWRQLLTAGVNVAVGTDSLASAPDMSILGELQFLRHRHKDIPAIQLFAMATCNGAAAIGRADTLGRLAPGSAADLTVWPMRDGSPDDADSILADLIDHAPAPQAVFVAGRLCEPHDP